MMGILVCLICHCLMDFTAPLFNGMATEQLGNVLSTQAAYAIIYIFLTFIAAAAIWVIRYLKRNWKK